LKIYIYARVSTKDKGQDVDNQLRQLREFALKQGWEVVHVFVDHETGSKADRVQFQAMMLGCSQRHADLVLFWALDRFTREGALPTLQHLNTLTSYGVGFKSYTEQYLDSCGIFKDAVISILATIAKQERQRIRERVMAGLDRAREKGVRLGRPVRAMDRKQIAYLREIGYSWRAIGKRVGVSPATAMKALESPKKAFKKGVRNHARK